MMVALSSTQASASSPLCAVNSSTTSPEKSAKKSGKLFGCEAELAVAFLRARHPVKTANAVAAETGIAIDTVRRWFNGGHKPGFDHVVRLISAYGPEFLYAIMPEGPAWLRDAYRAERQRRLEAEIAAKRAEIQALGASS